MLVSGPSGWQYASRSVCGMLGVPERELLRDGVWRHIHDEDRSAVRSAVEHGEPEELVIRLQNRFGDGAMSRRA